MNHQKKRQKSIYPDITRLYRVGTADNSGSGGQSTNYFQATAVFKYMKLYSVLPGHILIACLKFILEGACAGNRKMTRSTYVEITVNFELAKSEARSLHHECLLIAEMAFFKRIPL